MAELSIIIPSRNERFLKNTVENILANIEADTEIIIGLDGLWADPVIEDNPKVHIVYVPESIGQRAIQNKCVMLSDSRYVMKIDAHCTVDKGFDRKLIEGFKVHGDNVAVVPIMRNLWAFDWKCYKCGWRKYQSPTPDGCPICLKDGKGKGDVRRKIMFVGKTQEIVKHEKKRGHDIGSAPQSVSYCFDSEPHFQYFDSWRKTATYKEQLKTGFTETMSLQGSCFMVTRDNYWKLNLCDESLGSWGSQGIEVAVKTWLSGGRVLVNHNTYYAHMFRTQGGDFSFPYEQSGKSVQQAKAKVRDLFFKNKYEHQVYPLSWLVDKFKTNGWSEDELAKIRNCLLTKKDIV